MITTEQLVEAVLDWARSYTQPGMQGYIDAEVKLRSLAAEITEERSGPYGVAKGRFIVAQFASREEAKTWMDGMEDGCLVKLPPDAKPSALDVVRLAEEEEEEEG